MNNNDYVEFGDVARNNLNMQCQYASRYLEDSKVRYIGDVDDYHNLMIHKEDVEGFVRFVKKERGIK